MTDFDQTSLLAKPVFDNFYWLASFPRSGNTLFRQIVYAGWGIRSASVYPNDLGGDRLLEESCGHYEVSRTQSGQLIVQPGSLLKTHGLPSNSNRVIYLIRDARAAYVSLYFFLNQKHSMRDVILNGWLRFRWDHNVNVWTGAGTIDCLIRYEDLVGSPDRIVRDLESLFGPATDDPLSPLSRRNEFAEKNSKWIRAKSDWRDMWSRDIDRLFWDTHGETFRRYYPDEKPLY